MADVQTIMDEAQATICVVGDAVLSVPRSPPTEAIMGTMLKQLKGMSGKATLLLVIPENAPPTGGASKGTTLRMFKEIAEHLGRFAIVVEASGFVGVAQRGLISMIVAAVMRKVETKTFATVSAAAQWLGLDVVNVVELMRKPSK